MQFGAMFLADPPVKRLVELARRAEDAGFDYFWLNDAPTQYTDPWPVFALIADATERIKIGPLVTNPVSRDWGCLAGSIATLDDVSDGRMVIGLGRGDIAVRATGKRPASVPEFGRFAQAMRQLVGGETAAVESGTEVTLQWSRPWPLELWGAAYGPKALRVVAEHCDGLIIQTADLELVRYTAGHIAEGARAAGREPSSAKLMVGAPAYVSDDLAAAHAEVRWFSTMVAEHVGELMRRTDGIPPGVAGLASHRDERKSLEHVASADIPDELNERNCLVGPASAHIDRLRALEAAGVGLFSAYLSHDRAVETIDAYGADVIPHWAAVSAS